MAKQRFREWYEQRHGDWPGMPGENYDDIFRRLCDAVADYVDETVDELHKRAAGKE